MFYNLLEQTLSVCPSVQSVVTYVDVHILGVLNYCEYTLCETIQAVLSSHCPILEITINLKLSVITEPLINPPSIVVVSDLSLKESFEFQIPTSLEQT